MDEQKMIWKPNFSKLSTETVARKLLGKILVRNLDGKRLAGRIVECEAYLGVSDPGCHTFGGRSTPRNSSMFLPGGFAYVYQIYGVHWCLNLVTRTPDHPEAILIRAIEPLNGISFMATNRNLQEKSLNHLANGPGKLCQALQIQKSFNGISLASPELHIDDQPDLKSKFIVASARIGIAYAGEAARWPLRFSIKENAFVSKPWPK